MDKIIIFEDAHIRVIFQAGSSAELIFSFGDLITRAKGLSINAEKSLGKYHFNVIGVMPKEKTWFPAQSMQGMLQAVAPYLADFPQRIAYAGSMGAYAAIKYSAALGLSRVVALVPQYSINPDDVVDPRYNLFYQPELHQNMHITAQDIAADCEYIVVYDPYCAEDRAHYEKIQHCIAHVQALHVPFIGHDAIAVLANSSLLYDFLKHPFDPLHFYQRMREVKKQSKFYYRKLLAQALPRHRTALSQMLKSYPNQLDAHFFDAQLKQNLIRELFNNKQVNADDLAKLGIDVKWPVGMAAAVLHTPDGQSLVFNVISKKIESYSDSAIQRNSQFLLPLEAKGNRLVSVELNDQSYLIVMNDRQVMQLLDEDEPLDAGIHPLLLRKYVGYYLITYQQLYLSADVSGECQFISEPQPSCQFSRAQLQTLPI